MKTIFLTALILAIEVGFVVSVAMAPTPRAAPLGGPDVVAGRNATELRAATPGARS